MFNHFSMCIEILLLLLQYSERCSGEHSPNVGGTIFGEDADFVFVARIFSSFSALPLACKIRAMIAWTSKSSGLGDSKRPSVLLSVTIRESGQRIRTPLCGLYSLILY